MLIVCGYFLLLSSIGFMLMAMDKKRSQTRKWRIPEKRFWLIAFLGGGIGIYGGMKAWHHKTKHKTFTIGVPIVILFNLCCYGLVIYALTQ